MTSDALLAVRSGPAAHPRAAAVFVFLLANVIAWSVYSEFSHGNGAIHQDVAEAYAWGREFQLGYFKHPPFWAWIAGIWFLFMPHQSWAFWLLAVLNANLGLLGAWKLIGRFAEGDKRIAATLLLLLTPFYTFLSFKYNANSIFLSLWPWTAYFFVRSIEERGLLPAALFGVLAAADILSKYFAAVLLATCLIAALVHPARGRYFTSARPYIAMGVAAVLVAPHILWLVTTGFLPFHYLESETGNSFLFALQNAFVFLGGCAALQVLVALAVMLMNRRWWRSLSATLRERGRDWRFRFLAVLGFGPALLAALLGPLLHVRVDTNMAIGIFCPIPLLLIEIAAIADYRRAARFAFGCVLALTAVALSISPIAPYEAFLDGEPTSVDPRQEVAAEGTRIWHQTTATALRIVTGEGIYAGATAFYSADRPTQLIDFNFQYSPWVTPDDIARWGLLAICDKKDPWCLASAAAFVTPQTVRMELMLRHDFQGLQGPPVTFVFFIVPPRR